VAAVGSGSAVVAVRRLRRGGWHVNHLLTVDDRRGRRHRLVLRRWARPGWERDDPDYTAEREVRVLRLLAASAVPAPVVVAADTTGDRCGVPALLLTRLAGGPPVSLDHDRLGQLAHALALIHAIDGLATVPPYRLYAPAAGRDRPDWLRPAPLWKRAIAAVPVPLPTAVPRLLHRDYHPENTLWSRGRLTGIVDWTQASVGPAGLDVAHMRWNLVVGFGVRPAHRFLRAYRAAAGTALPDQAVWDLVSVLDLVCTAGPLPRADVRRLTAHVGGILGQLG